MLYVYLVLAFIAGLLVGGLTVNYLKKRKPLTAEDLRDLEIKALLLCAEAYEETARVNALSGMGTYAETVRKFAETMRVKAADLLKDPAEVPLPVQRIVQFSVHNGGKSELDPGA